MVNIVSMLTCCTWGPVLDAEGDVRSESLSVGREGLGCSAFRGPAESMREATIETICSMSEGLGSVICIEEGLNPGLPVNGGDVDSEALLVLGSSLFMNLGLGEYGEPDERAVDVGVAVNGLGA